MAKVFFLNASRLRRSFLGCVVFLLFSCAGTSPTVTAPHSSDPYYTPNYPAPKPGTNPSDRYDIKHDRGSSVPINVDGIPDAVPIAEPYSAGGNQSPYTVLGETYHVLASAKGYREEGIASWYGEKFHGHKTSNGETYSIYKMTAAHKTLPIPCYARVTNLQNNRSVIVRVNDRGPFKAGRIMDLSQAAATKLGYTDQGTARVLVEVVDAQSINQPSVVNQPSASEVYSANSPQPDMDKGGFYLQVGAFSNPDNARQQKLQLMQRFSYPVIVSQIPGQEVWRVKIGPVTQRDALYIQDEVAGAGLGQAVLVSP